MVKNTSYNIMNDIISDVVKYLDKKEIDVDSFINKYTEKDIVDDFLSKCDKIDFRYNDFLNIVDVNSFDIDGVFSNYTKNI
jgi:hypothetical protein